jgi:hypothetical protein
MELGLFLLFFQISVELENFSFYKYSSCHIIKNVSFRYVIEKDFNDKSYYYNLYMECYLE